ncbi:hypothetical protein [Pseudorhodoferax sp.]|uniref:hypothetical protein n=1 Tax=Pseudorhodoferax sp. TaxID=1993553 RepID=UPI0039E5DC09
MKFTYVVLTNPTSPEDEAEFNRWYTEQHLQDVLRVPGVVSAQRYKRTDQQRGSGPQPWNYLALYECDAASPDVVTNGIQERYNTPDMVISPTLAAARYACYFEPMTEPVRKKA